MGGHASCGDCARNSDRRHGTSQCRCLRNSRAKHVRARILICRRCGRRLALVDVLESGNDDPVQGHRQRKWFYFSLSQSESYATAWHLPALLPFGGVSNSGEMAFVPNGYTSYQLSPNLWMGLSINAPFGLSVSTPDRWAGRNYSGDSLLKTYNATPSIAYRINDWISVGVGVQLQYAKAEFVSGLGHAGSVKVLRCKVAVGALALQPALLLRRHPRRSLALAGVRQ